MPFKEITPVRAKQLMKNSSALLVDIRDSQSFAESHDPAAYNLTETNLEDFMNNTSKEIPILVICYHGNSSQPAAEYLSEEGFMEVYSVIGGYEAWETYKTNS